MPAFNGRGPVGMGPMTGRGFGPCGLGLGWRKRSGGGRGLGRYFGWNWPQTKKDKLQALKDYKQSLREEQEDVDKELKDLAKEE
jgi:hypothetical protein